MFTIEADAYSALLKVTLRDVADRDELARLLMGIETARPYFSRGYRLWLTVAAQSRPLQGWPIRVFDTRTPERHVPVLQHVVIELAPGDLPAQEVGRLLAGFYRALPVPVTLVGDSAAARRALALPAALAAGAA
ncbi:hypothetical protein [Chitinolyticbacter albus]|uniref:hypothetical protein n=1 Tax=Chitinolyticbacter albus TaxID=2961951 RepID=UPI00210A3B14|nr:hypothetical protein [Chitinolyticbacter albus]